MDKEFLQEVKKLGSAYLVEFTMERAISGPRDLVHALEHHAGNLQAIIDKGYARGEDPKALAGQFEGMMGGFETQEDELAHVNELLSTLKSRFGIGA